MSLITGKNYFNIHDNTEQFIIRGTYFHSFKDLKERAVSYRKGVHFLYVLSVSKKFNLLCVDYTLREEKYNT